MTTPRFSQLQSKGKKTNNTGSNFLSPRLPDLQDDPSRKTDTSPAPLSYASLKIDPAGDWWTGLRTTWSQHLIIIFINNINRTGALGNRVQILERHAGIFRARVISGEAHKPGSTGVEQGWKSSRRRWYWRGGRNVQQETTPVPR